MIKEMLDMQEIPAYVQGEYLQSGSGELPINGLVKVSVDNENYSQAKGIIKDWESKEPTKSTSSAYDSIRNQKSQTKLIWLLASFVLGAILMRLYAQGPVTYNGLDLNNDKVNDVNWTYKNNVLTKSEGDYNLDGKVDDITIYNNGLLLTSNQDSDFDGTFDTEYQYSNERLTLQKVDANNDGELDVIIEFESIGLNFTSTIFNPQKNFIKKVQHFKMNKLVSAELDTNDDGELDVAISYDFAEEEISRKPLVTTRSN